MAKASKITSRFDVSDHELHANVPNYMRASLTDLGEQWKNDPERPAVDPDIELRYEEVLRQWIEHEGMPLLIRKHRKNRGHRLIHVTGRVFVPVDNSPANWFLSNALNKQDIELKDIVRSLDEGTLPVGMVVEKGGTYTGRLGKMLLPDLNALGWKICHIHPIGIGRGDLTQMDMALLKEHMQKFLSIKNMFLIPKSHGGLGEVPEMTEVFSNG